MHGKAVDLQLNGFYMIEQPQIIYSLVVDRKTTIFSGGLVAFTSAEIHLNYKSQFALVKSRCFIVKS